MARDIDPMLEALRTAIRVPPAPEFASKVAAEYPNKAGAKAFEPASQMTPSTQTHTPGPWRLELHAHNSANGASIIGSDGSRVCSLPRAADRPYDQKLADAELIAAAPSLLQDVAALRASLSRLVAQWRETVKTSEPRATFAGGLACQYVLRACADAVEQVL